MTFGLACCAIEMMHAAAPRYDADRSVCEKAYYVWTNTHDSMQLYDSLPGSCSQGTFQ